MAYSFRFYGKSNPDWFVDDHVHALEYDLQFRSPLTPGQLDALGELVERHFTSGPAVPLDTWQISDRFVLATFGARYPGAGRRIPYDVTDFLMEARRVCPLVDVVLRNAPSAGDSAWDQWTHATQPAPDPGPDWGQRTRGFYQRALDPTLPAPAPDATFDAARRRTVVAAQRTRALDVEATGGLTVSYVEAAQVPAASAPTLPDDTPRNAMLALHPDGKRALRLDPSTGAIFELDAATNTWREAWTSAHKLTDLAWAGDLWALQTEDTIELRDPSTPDRPLVGEPYGIKGKRLTALAGGRLLLHVSWNNTLTALACAPGGRLTKRGSVHFAPDVWLAEEVAGRIFFGVRDLPGGDRIEVHGLGALAPTTAPPSVAGAARTNKKKTSSKKKPALSLEPVDALPPPTVEWPDATHLEKPCHLAQIAPDGTQAMFWVQDKRRASTLRIERPDGTRLQVSEEPTGAGFKDLALEPGARSVMVAGIVERFREADLQESATSYLPRGNSIPNLWVFTEVDLSTGEASEAFLLELAPKPLSDGSKRGYRDLRRVVRPGGVGIAVWSKQPYHTMRWLSPDDLLVVYQKGAFWMQRTADGWQELGHLQATGTLDATGVAGAHRVVALVGTGKTRLTVYADLGGKVKKLATFTDAVAAVHARGERLFVTLADDTHAEIVGFGD